MESGDDGSSTESEYYDLSDDEHDAPTAPTHIEDADNHAHGGAGLNHPETIVIEVSEDDQEDECDDANATAFTAMMTQWNNILTPDLEAAVARIAALTTRRSRVPPLAIPLDPPVETLPHSGEFVSPFAALATPTPQPRPVKEEKTSPVTVAAPEPHPPAVETKQEAVLTTSKVKAPVRMVIDLSLDSDDDEEDEGLVRKAPTPPAQAQATPTAPLRAGAPSPPPPSRTTVSDIRSAPPARTQLQPVSDTDHRSRPPPPGHVAHQPARPAYQATPVVKLTLSCTRCHRLVPDHSTATPERARYDCKCCGQKYAREELSVPGANRRCSFCKPLPLPGENASSSGAAASTPQPQTPLSAAEEAAVYEASISPAAPVITPSPRAPQARAQASPRPVGSSGFTVSRPTEILPPSRPVFTCVTCHQPLKVMRSLASVERAVDPWFCTCCQRLLCMKESPPDSAPGSRLKGIPRCMSCAIAACDLDSQMEKRRPHLEPLQELRRLSRLLQTILDKLMRQLRDHKRDADAKAIEQDPIKLEIDKRFSQWRFFMHTVRGGQRRTLQRDNVTLQEQRSLFKQQLALEQQEADVRSRLVAYVAVTLHANKVPLPRAVRGIVGDTSQKSPRESKSRQKAPSAHAHVPRQPPLAANIERVKARSRAETEKTTRSNEHRPHRRPFSFIESDPPTVYREDDRQDSGKRHKDARYLAYESHR